MKHETSSLISTLEQELSSLYKTKVEQQQVAWWLLQAATNSDLAHLLISKELELTQEQERILKTWVHEHVVDQKPLQYILGTVPFGSLTISVAPPILIPRPETEEWTFKLIEFLKPLNAPLSILDLCTGSGCIALLIAKELPKSQILATDISPKALSCAQANAQANNIKNVSFERSDLFENLAPEMKFDLIISNPPYIASSEWNRLDPMVTQWEDRNALVSEHHGLYHIEKIIKKAPIYLKPNDKIQRAGAPQLIIEIGYRQGNAVKELMRSALFEHVQIWKDLEGKDRVVCGRMPL